VQEELGLEIRPWRLLIVDWVPGRPERTEGVMMIYAGGVLDPERETGIRLPGEELRSWAWCTPGEADELFVAVDIATGSFPVTRSWLSRTA
jgi:8-oxo-dGTP diphosphatase